MNIIAYGGGTNSVAMLIGLHSMAVPIDIILFADTGAEQPHTYAYLEPMNQWLYTHGLPHITIVETVDRYGMRFTLEDECLRSCTLPSIAYGFKRCSHKHKIAPQKKYCNHLADCRAVWAQDEKVCKFVGFDAGEMRRYNNALKYDVADKKYRYEYPLIEWGWSRNDCMRVIEEAGLPQPGKSSCFFCPSMKKAEIIAMKENHPELFSRAIAIEDAAAPYLKSVKGLGRNWSWRSFMDAT